MAEKTWLRILGTLNEYQARLFVAEKASQLGRGGISRLSQLTGMSRVTITQGLNELRAGKKLRTAAERVRQPGGGRKKVEQSDPELPRYLKTIVEETTAGDPMSPLRWTSKSTRTIAEELSRAGHPISSVTVGRCLEEMGYTLQANVKTREGSQPSEPRCPVSLPEPASEVLPAGWRPGDFRGHEEEGTRRSL